MAEPRFARPSARKPGLHPPRHSGRAAGLRGPVIGELVSRFDEENVTITRLAIPTAVMVESPSGDVGPGAAVGPTSKKKSIRRKSMIRVSVLYPQKEGASFDHEYYARKHIPFVRETLEPFGMVRAEVDKGLAGGPGESPLFVAAIMITFVSLSNPSISTKI